MVIPRVIHQIWIGHKPVPTHWTATWAEQNPGWEYCLWREEQLADLGMRHRALYESYVADGSLDGAADVARVEILLRHGGVYVDADMSCTTPLDGAPFLSRSMFTVYSPNAVGRITNAAMGCVPGHPAMDEYSEALGEVVERYPCWQRIGAGILTPIATRRDDVVVLPSGAFLPLTMEFKPGPAYDGIVYGEHHWGTTHDRY